MYFKSRTNHIHVRMLKLPMEGFKRSARTELLPDLGLDAPGHSAAGHPSASIALQLKAEAF